MKRKTFLEIMIIICVILAFYTVSEKAQVVNLMNRGYYPLIDVMRYYGYNSTGLYEFKKGDDIVKFEQSTKTLIVNNDKYVLSEEEFLLGKNMIYLSNSVYMRAFGISVDNDGTTMDIVQVDT
ncbi:MAG: hypothetical protein IKN74_04570 [Clostridia bacterium]|nr:hypothetical protein [Clostridia bacterium]